MNQLVLEPSAATIITINDIREIKDHLNPAGLKERINAFVLALIDFDDTMAMSGHPQAGHLGGPKWRDTLRKCILELKEAKELPDDTRVFEYLTLFIAKSVKVSAVQPEFAALVREMEDAGFKLMVFTARGNSGENAWYKLSINGIDKLTEQQMHAAGIRLSQSPLPAHQKIYNHSMIFANNKSKGEIIGELFDRNVFRLEDIALLIFADDKRDSVAAVQKFADAKGIPFKGFHYTAVEAAEEKEFDLLKSTIQMVNLFAKGHFMNSSDLEAKVTEFKAVNKTSAKDYFKDVIKKLDRMFRENNLHIPFDDTDHFYTKVTEVARRVLQVS